MIRKILDVMGEFTAKKMLLWCCVLLGLILPMLLGWGCQQNLDRVKLYAPEVSIKRFSVEPKIRIRVGVRRVEIKVGGSSGILVGTPLPGSGIKAGLSYGSGTRVRYDGARWIIIPPDQRGVSWAVPNITLSSVSGKIELNGVVYAGHLSLHGRTALGSSPGRASFDVVNHVNLEAYLPGVLHKELYPNWRSQTYRAQAIAARSYALAKMDLRKKRYFDLEASQASQAYGGASARGVAVHAVADTRGIVLSFEGHIVPAYYSSCVGGISQDASEIFPHQRPMAPLASRVVGPWGSNSPYYEWGPIRRNAVALSRRIREWGKAGGHGLRGLGKIVGIEASRVGIHGRPTAYTVADDGGGRFKISAEQLRIACNYKAGGLSKLNAQSIVRSSFLAIAVSGDVVAINGRGFGHGVGMGQYGAEHMASQGYSAYQILHFYYPKAQLLHIYE